MSSETISHGHAAEASVHSHDSHEAHGHDHHHEESFLSKYVFSTDHKMIGKQFLITGIIWAIIGGWFSVLFPLQIGARDMASGFMNMLSYWFFFLASVVMFASLFIQTGPASGGWTIYPPLSALGQASEGSKLGMDFWLISMALFIVSSLLGGLNYISTILNLRTKGMSMTRMPLTMWAIFFTAVLGLLSFPVLLSGAVLLLFDRNLGTSFYLSEIVVKGEILPNEGGSAILFQHLFWFLGHPEVYIILLPALGMVSEILSVNSRKPIFGYLAMVGSLFAICILAFLVWAHHMFVTGLNPFLGAFFVLLTLLIAVPSAIKVFNWLTTLWKGNIRFTPGMLFSIGFISLFISGGLTGIFLGNSTLDIHLHDTYFVVAHFHIVMGVASFFGMFAGVYHWFPKMYGRFLNNTMAYIHFWVTLVGAYLIFWPMHYSGLAGMPRRYTDWSNWQSFNQFQDMNRFISTVAMIVFAVQILFVFNFFYSIFKGRKVTSTNPWGANTLEWTTPINPGHGNWPGDIPEVHRWAYDYSKDGREFIPQTEPIGADESKH